MKAPRTALDLDALAALAAAFARAYPALAPHLAERSADPDAERLLEAFTWLTARVDALLDDGRAVAQSLGPLVAPELDRPFPCATIVAIAPPRERRHVPAGATFESASIGGTTCRFTAWSAFDLVPWRVGTSRLAWSAEEGTALELELVATGDGDLATLLPLRLHLAGEARLAGDLALWLRSHLRRVELEAAGAVVDLGARLRPWGLEAAEALLPPEPYEHVGLRLLREYLVLPAKFAFLEVPRPAVGPVGSAAKVTLRFLLDVPLPSDVALGPEDVRVDAVPVVNVFPSTSDPLSPSLERPAHVLRPAGIPFGRGEVYAIERVLAGRGGTVSELPPFAEIDLAPDDDAFWVTERLPAAHGGGSEVRLSLGSPADRGPVPDVDFVSVELLATNGPLPQGLGVGDIRRSELGEVRNIAAITPYRPPPSGDELRFRTLALAARAALPLVELAPLRTLLQALDLHGLEDGQAARAHAQRVAAIEGLRVVPARAITKDGEERAVVLGHDLELRLSQAGFDGEGDVLVFASVLARLFAHEATLGAFARTTARVVETGRSFSFPAASGDRTF